VNKRILMGVEVFLFCVGAATAQHALFPTKAQIAVIGRSPEWGALRSSCVADLSLKSHPVSDYSPPPHYTADGPRTVAESGVEPILRRETAAIYRLSLCYEISKDTRDSAKAEELLNGWSHTTARIGTEQGKAGFNFYFPYALMGAFLLREDAGWEDDSFDRFVRSVVLPFNNAERQNNHANWGVLLMASAGTYLQDGAIVDKARARWLALMDSQVAQDGSMPLEICRSNTSDWCGGKTKGMKGLAYTHYALLPTAVAAEIFHNEGKSVYDTPEAALMCKAYRRAASWTLQPKTFPYYATNDGKLIGVNGVSYFYVLQTRCPSPDASAVLKEYGLHVPDPFLLGAMYGGTH
jgi:hypothetical protein